MKPNNLPPEQWWFVPNQVSSGGVSNGNQCPVAEIEQRGKKDGPNAGSGVSQFPPPYTNSGSGPTLSIDHVYELSMLETFFASQFTDPDDPRCEPFIKVFSQIDQSLTDQNDFLMNGGKGHKEQNNPTKYQDTRLQSLWNQGPNKLNKAFIGCDQNVNGVKGKFFNPGLKDIQKVQEGTDKASAYKNLNLWNDLWVIYPISGRLS